VRVCATTTENVGISIFLVCVVVQFSPAFHIIIYIGIIISYISVDSKRGTLPIWLKIDTYNINYIFWNLQNFYGNP